MTISVRVITQDGIFVSEDFDFAEDAKFDWFDETVRQADVGEVVQLIEGDLVTAEKIVE